MAEQSRLYLNLVESQLINQNPFQNVILEVKQLMKILEKQLQDVKQKTIKLKKLISQHGTLSKKQKKLTQIQIQQKAQQAQENYAEKPNQEQDHHYKTRKELQIHNKSIETKQKQIQKCKIRVQLLSLGGSITKLSVPRLDQLEKIFHHYCHYIFKSGKHVTFDRIQYEKEHLIMERFFAFIHDFHLNKFNDTTRGIQKQLIPKHQLILIFKKASSNSRNLQFSEFIACLQKLAALRYDFIETYQQRKAREEAQRRRIKQINLRRQKQRDRRTKARQEQEQRQRQEQQRKKAEQQEQKRRQQQQLAKTQMLQHDVVQNKAEQKKDKKKKDKDKKKKKKQKNGQNNLEDESQNPDLRDKSESNNQPNQNNDQLLNQMMNKDDSIENPNQQFQRLKKFKKSPSKKAIEQEKVNMEELQRQQILTVSKQQKVQLLYRIIDIDNPISVDQKLRQYEKPMFKVLAEQRKQSLLNSSSISKVRQTQFNHGLRLGQLKEKINQRKVQKIKKSMSRSITDEKYSQKKKQDYQKYVSKALAIKYNHDVDALDQKTNTQFKRKNQGIPLSLNMLNQSSQDTLNRLKLGSNIKRYLHPEEEDKLYLKQYGGLQRMRASNSSHLEKSPRLSVDIKRRANEVEEAQKRNEQQKMQRFALQMYKNQHYMKRFLQRKM